MTQPRIEHSDVSEYVQMALSAKEDMETTAEQAEIWASMRDTGALESAATEAASHIEDVLSELRRIAKETGDQT